MAGTGEALPEPLEEDLFEIHFDVPTGERDERFEALCTQNPDYDRVLRKRRRSLERSDRALGRAHGDLQDALQNEKIGPYTVQRVLGEGGFGTVYLAQQHEPVRRFVALKVLQAGRGDTRSRQRFEDERHLLARLQHTNIAQVYDAGITEDKQQFFAMEYVDGLPITDWCRKENADTDTRLRMILRTCAAIQHAHQREVVHRDLKPSNILVGRQDGEPLPKVIDFGIAKLLAAENDPSSGLTVNGGLIGTPGYMSPEQAAGDLIDTRSDVYSLGVLLCELLTGKPPIARDLLANGNLHTLARVLAEHAPERPSTLLDQQQAEPGLLGRLREDLDWIVLKATAPNREDRYASVQELADDIERHLNGEPVRARQRATVYLVRKFVHRNWLLVSVSAIVIVSLFAAIASLAWGLDVAQTAQTQAEDDRDVALSRERAARMATAQLALGSGDGATARHYLTGVGEDQRGWEWRHLAQQLDRSEWQTKVSSNTLDIQWLDDERVVSFPRHKSFKVWNRATGELEREIPFRGTYRAMHFDPDTNTALLAADEGVSLWDLESGEELFDYGRVPREPFAVARSEELGVVAIAGYQEWLMVLDAETGALRFGEQLAHNATKILFVDDLMLVGYRTGTIEARTVAGDVLWTLEGHVDNIEDLVLDERRGVLYSSSIDGTVRAWRLSTHELLVALDVGLRVRRLSLSPDGSSLYGSGGWAAVTMLAWDTQTFQLLGRYHGHQKGIRAMAVSPDGKKLATSSRDETLRMWSAEAPRAHDKLHAGHDTRVLSASLDGKRFAAAGTKGTVSIWDAETLQLEQRLETEIWWLSCALGRSTCYATGSTRDGIAVYGYDIETGQEIARSPFGRRRVEGMAIDPQERWIVGGHNGRLMIWSLPELELRHELEVPVGAARMAWDASTQCFAVAGNGATAYWIDPEAGTIRDSVTVEGTSEHLRGIAIQDDLLVVGSPRLITGFRNGVEVIRFEGNGESLQIAADGTRLITGGADQKVRIWDLRSGNQLLVLDEPEYGVPYVHSVAGGKRIVAVTHRWRADSYIYAWNAPDVVELDRTGN